MTLDENGKVKGWNYVPAPAAQSQLASPSPTFARPPSASTASRIARRWFARARSTSAAARASSSSARTCSGWARSSFAARTTFSRRFRSTGARTASSRFRAETTRRASRWRRELLGIPATIVMPSDAPEVKLAATRGYGAEVVLYERERSHREEIAAGIAAERGATVVPPFDDPRIVAGAGTAALELLEEAGPLDAIVVPVGGGGLDGRLRDRRARHRPEDRDLRRRAGNGRRFRAVARARRARKNPRAEDDRRRLANHVAQRADVRHRARARLHRRYGQRRRVARSRCASRSSA